MQNSDRYLLRCGLAAVILTSSGCTTTTNNVTQQQVVIVSGAQNSGAVLPAGGILACSLEPKLKSTSGVQKIVVTFQNETGADLKLFWLSYDGQRKFYSTISAGLTKQQETFITHPWVISDTSDKCLEIVMPGRLTQTVVLRSAPTQSSSKPPAVPQ